MIEHVKPTPFATWQQVLDYVSANGGAARLYYKAPLDVFAAVVWCTRRGLGTKLRCSRGDIKFWADAEHLERFGRKF